MRKVKIVCTLGPSTAGVERLAELIAAGMDVARLNFSHGEPAAQQQLVHDLREAARRLRRPIALLGDLSGPKIRVGKMRDGAVELAVGAALTLTSRDLLGEPGLVSHSYAPLHRDVHPGEAILLDDGLLALEVEAVDGEEVRCRVKVGGTLRDRKGMNLPGTVLSTPALTEKDRADLARARDLGVDYLALSFVRSADDIREAKALAGEIPVIAKIEKPEAVAALEAILAAADGVMVARGDLGVELGHEKVPLVQKRIIRDIRLHAKPVITATQMLDSMTHSPTPTRAEVSDVANAVLDGTDAVMLSGETSVGQYPVQAVRTMAAIIDEIERSELFTASLFTVPEVCERTPSNAVANAVADMAEALDLAAIAVYSESGRSARLASAHRSTASVICFSRDQRVLNRLSLFWGVRPLPGKWGTGVEEVVTQAERELLRQGLVQVGDTIAVTFGLPLGDEPFQTNMIRLGTVRALTPGAPPAG